MSKKFSKFVLGYGSLINLHSLRRTCPTATILEVVEIRGFQRIFNKPTPNYAALNVIETKNSKDFFNAVIVEITNKEEFRQLELREEGYSKLKISINNKEVVVFSSLEEPMLYRYETQRQREYLQTCLNGAKDLGDEFYKNFLQTTLIEKTLLAKDFYMVKELEKT